MKSVKFTVFGWHVGVGCGGLIGGGRIMFMINDDYAVGFV